MRTSCTVLLVGRPRPCLRSRDPGGPRGVVDLSVDQPTSPPSACGPDRTTPRASARALAMSGQDSDGFRGIESEPYH